jgi:hypothetical protein
MAWVVLATATEMHGHDVEAASADALWDAALAYRDGLRSKFGPVDYYGEDPTTGQDTLLVCGDCGRPTLYSYIDEAYHHAVDAGRGCFLIPAEDRPDDPNHPLLAAADDEDDEDEPPRPHGARVRLLGQQLSAVMDDLGASDNDDDREAAGDLDRALDRIDSAIVSLRGGIDGDDPTCEHGLYSKAYVCNACGELLPMDAPAVAAKQAFAAAYAGWKAQRAALSDQEASENPPGDAWEGSDDNAVELLDTAVRLLGIAGTTPVIPAEIVLPPIPDAVLHPFFD